MSQCQQLQQQQAMLSMSSLIDASSTKMIIINDRFKRQSSSLSDSHHHHHHSSTIKLQRFLIEPENLTVNIGESIILPCRVSNKAGTVQWTRDGFGLGADPRLEGFPTYSMMHNDATESMIPLD
ncbi:hypothetical protein DERF_014217 [Dermatophagoides farinae]|uniref:Ig-like domain-containing protein n=1 Tax=Dermatophagoides farinae TaxID=6954 RepID=A0A922HH51_DERFA|nr:hypothetical protein DERF_014217 [Dermatophagoides farinae]